MRWHHAPSANRRKLNRQTDMYFSIHTYMSTILFGTAQSVPANQTLISNNTSRSLVHFKVLLDATTRKASIRKFIIIGINKHL